MAMDIRIGSLNCLNLSKHSELKKDISLIARIIIRERFDVVALQEVKNGGLDTILTSLNGNNKKGKWAGCADNNDYAFVWNTEHLTLPKTKLPNGQIRTSYPRVYNQYKRDPELGRISFARPPFYGRFQTNYPGLPKVEIRLINAHIRFSKGKDGEELAPNVRELLLRKFEFQALTRCIYYYVSDKVYGKPEGESSPLTAYTILLGDYNMNLRRSGASSSFLDNLETVEIKCGRSRKDDKIIVTRQSELTTLKKQKDSDGENTEQDDEQRTEQKAQIFANNYDHFSYDTNRFSGTRKRISRVNTVEKYCNNDPQEHIKKISDHTPIKMSLNIKKE
jgi:ribosomal protein L29